MATTSGSSTPRRSQASHQGANGAGEYPSLSSSKRGNGSAAELRAGANSAAKSGQPSAWAQPNTVSRLFAPQTTASKSSRPAPDDDTRQVTRYPTDSPHRGASGPHNPTAPALSSSKSSALFAAPRITESPSTTTMLQSDDKGADRETHRVAKRTVLEGQSPYSNSSKGKNGSVTELHELRAGANSAANSSQPPTAWGRSDPTSRPFAPQTTTSKSSRPTADDDVERVAQYTTDSPRRGASSGPHNATAPALSSSKSSALFAPRITESPSTTTIPQSDARGMDRETHRVSKRTVLEGQSPYSNSSKSRNGSAAELHEIHTGANSVANSSQPPTAWGRSDPTSRPPAPQTTTSKSSRPTADDDAERVAQYTTDSSRRGAGGPHNATAPGLSSSKSSALFAPRITESPSTTTILQSDDRLVDRASQRVAKRSVPEGGSPYSSFTRVNGSAAELNEHVMDANSSANSGQPPLGRPNPTSRTFAPQTTASESSRSAAGDEAGQAARNQTDSSHKGAGGQHNPTAPALSSSKSSALFAPRITESPSTATIPHSDDRATDRETHRVTKRTGLEGQLPYSNSSKSRNGSVAELHELRAGANSASNPSQQPTTWGRPDPTRRPFAPQTTASESSRPTAGDDAGQVVRYLTDAPWRGTGGPYSSVAASSSKSSLSRITQLGDATLESSLPAPVSGQHRAETNSHAPKKTPKSSKQRVVNVGFLAEPSLGERATQDRVGQLRKTNSNISESWQNSDLLSPAQTAAGQQDSLSPPAKDPPGAKKAYQVRVDPPRGANSSISESQNVDPASGAQTLAVQPVRTPPELPVYPNESRVSAPTDEKGYHGTPSNKREAPNSVSSQLPVYRDDSLVSAPTDEKGYHGAPSPWREAPNNVSSTHAAEHPLPTPPKAVWSSPIKSRDRSEPADSAMAGKIAVDDETSLTPPPPAFLPPLKGTVRGKSPNGSFGSKRTGSETSLASRTPPTEGRGPQDALRNRSSNTPMRPTSPMSASRGKKGPTQSSDSNSAKTTSCCC